MAGQGKQMFVAWLHLLQSLQPDMVVLDERGIWRRVRWQERGEEGIGEGRKIAKWQRDLTMKRLMEWQMKDLSWRETNKDRNMERKLLLS